MLGKLTGEARSSLPVTEHGAFSAFLFSPEAVSALTNSFLIAVLVALWCTPIATLAGYAFSRYPYARTRRGMLFLAALKILPVALWILALRIIYVVFGLYDSRLGIWLIHCVPALLASTWIMKKAWSAVPVAVEELARLEGSSKLQIFFRLCLPLVYPSVLLTAALCFLISWSEPLLSLILTSEESLTLPAMLIRNITDASVLNIGIVSVGLLILMIPVIVIALLFRRSLCEIATAGLFPATRYN
jgi:ABC-type glycerol-3-phosphate transport system permease component